MFKSEHVFVIPQNPAPHVAVGMLGYAFMGKAHTNAYKKISHIFDPIPAIPDLEMICGLAINDLATAAQRYGYRTYTPDWHTLVENPNIQGRSTI